MGYITFSAAIQLLKPHLQPGISTYELLDALFDAYLCDNDVYLSPAQSSLWSRGKRPVPVPYLRYYQSPDGFFYLESALRTQVLPYVWDTDRLAEALEALITDDERMMQSMKESLIQALRGRAWLETTLAKLLVYAMAVR